MKTKSTPIPHSSMALAAPLTAALLIVLVMFQLAGVASAAPGPSPESGQQEEAVIQPGNGALLPANAVSVELRSGCYTTTEGGVSAMITNHSNSPQQVHVSAIEPPITQNTKQATDVTVPAGSTTEQMLGSWGNGSYVVAGATHAGLLKAQADFTINCGQPEPFAKAYSTCLWPGGRHIWVEIGNTGTADAVFNVTYMMVGDDFVTVSQHNIAPGQSFTLDHPVQESGTYLVKVRLDGSPDYLVDETIVIDCEPVDDTVTEPKNPPQGPKHKPAGTNGPSVDPARPPESTDASDTTTGDSSDTTPTVDSARPDPDPGGQNLPALTVVSEDESAGSWFGLTRVMSVLMKFVDLLLKGWV